MFYLCFFYGGNATFLWCAGGCLGEKTAISARKNERLGNEKLLLLFFCEERSLFQGKMNDWAKWQIAFFFVFFCEEKWRSKQGKFAFSGINEKSLTMRSVECCCCWSLENHSNFLYILYILLLLLLLLSVLYWLVGTVAFLYTRELVHRYCFFPFA